MKSLGDADHVVVSVSGGKDSTYLLWWALKNVPKEKILVVHAEIDIDWNETLDVVKKQCEFFGVPLKVVRATHADGSPKGFLSILEGTRKDRKTGELKEVKFPSPQFRWCTSELKMAPIHKFVRTLEGNIAVLIGERAEESSNRAKLKAWRPMEKLSKKGRTVVNVSPILQASEGQVWRLISKIGAPVHPCYNWGVKRASCAICIFSSDQDIEVAMDHAPNWSIHLDIKKKPRPDRPLRSGS